MNDHITKLHDRLTGFPLYGRLARLDEELAVLLLLAMVSVLSFQIVSRWLSISGSWAGELSRFMNVWLVYLLIARRSVADNHISVTYFYDRMPSQFIYGIYVINIFVGGALVYSSVSMMGLFSDKVSPAAGIPTPVLYLAGALGGTLFVGVQLYKLLHPVIERVT